MEELLPFPDLHTEVEVHVLTGVLEHHAGEEDAERDHNVLEVEVGDTKHLFIFKCLRVYFMILFKVFFFVLLG
jgi:hypothetical protein